MTQLVKFEELARELGVPKSGLQAEADRHGLTVQIGSARRIERESIKELIKLCRVAPKDPASISEKQRATARLSTPSETAKGNSRPAQIAAKGLKQCSTGT